MIGEAGDDVAVETPKDDYVLHSETVEAEKASEDKAEPEQSSDENSDNEQDTSSEGQKPKRGGFQKKIEKLSINLDQVMQENAKLKAQLEGKPSADASASKEPVDANDPEPNEDDFDNFSQFTKAQARWEARQEFKALKAQEAEQSQKQEAVKTKNERVESYRDKADEFTKVTPDFDAKIAEYQQSGYVSPIVESAIMDSDMGPQVAYYLATNPEEAMKLDGLGVVAVNKAIGKIEARLEGQGTPVKAAVKTTKAPQPISPVKSNSSASSKDPGEMPYEDYLKWRNKG